MTTNWGARNCWDWSRRRLGRGCLRLDGEIGAGADQDFFEAADEIDCA